MTTTATETTAARVADEIRRRQRFVVVSHARPDGDAIGSSLAMALALRHLGKEARVLSCDPVPDRMLVFPGVSDIEVVDHVDDTGDAVIVMECGDAARTGVRGIESGYVINIDHHPGNTRFGALNWLDLTAAACGEMVAELIEALAVPLTRAIATHLSVAILTDTGGFHFSNITPRTFAICGRSVAAGVNPNDVATVFFYSNSLGKVKLYGAVLHGMRLDATGRIVTMQVNQQLLDECGATYEDAEGLTGLVLSVQDIIALAFFKETGPGQWRVSLRSKGDIDVNAIAVARGGGGHRNASGCSARGTLADLSAEFQRSLADAIATAGA
jgi:phosphoesterase RecJ-like protein